MLQVPYEERTLASAAGARYYAGTGWAYTGKGLPHGLLRYRPEPYTWERWIEDDLLGKHTATLAPPAPDASTGSITPRPDQVQDIRSIMLARKAGAPEFLNASDMGSGKTVVALSAVKRMAGIRNVLVICPVNVMPSWRLHLRDMGDGGMNWCIVNYESTKKLLVPPASAAALKSRRAKNLRTVQDGTPRVQWDVVISDEAHLCANPESQQTRTVDKIIAGPSLRSAFSIRMTGTPGKDPARLSYLHRGLFWQDGLTPQAKITAKRYVAWCERHEFSVDQSGFGEALAWRPPLDCGPAELQRLNRLIFGGETKWAIRRMPDWPEQQRLAMPIELTYDEREAYATEWHEFQSAMKALQAKVDRAAPGQVRKARQVAQARGLAAQTRYRQKAGLVRAAGTAAFVAALVEKGNQVAISAEFLGLVDALATTLRDDHKIEVALLTGQQEKGFREQERIAYQRGEKKVIIYTPAEGFSLHAGETAVGGNSVPRVTVVAEPRWSPDKALQKEKRSQRNGSSAPVYYTFALNTVEEKVIRVVVEGMGNMARVNGDDTKPFENLTSALDVPFVVNE